MPSIEKHIEISLQRTGKPYREVHEWIDDPQLKNERHDITRVLEVSKMFAEKYGEAAAREYVQHLADDVNGRFNHTPQASDITLLREAGVSEEDIAHSIKVAEKALEIGARTGAGLDMELIGRGALFHDLGKAKTHEIEHGELGARMGATLGLPEPICALMEKHIRGGMSAEEALEFGLPVKDYTLRTLEERIIIYADRLVDIITDGIISLSDERDAETRFEEILTTTPRYGKNDRTLERYLGYHREIRKLMI